MITDSFDNKTPAKINLTRNENAPKADAVILTFSNKIEEFVAANYDCEKVGELWMATGMTPVYLINYNGKKIGFYRTYVGAAVQAMCDFRGVELYMFFTGGDLLDAPEWTERREKNQVKGTQHDVGHFDIALELAAYVADKE
jgi:hypothetical protein